MAYSVRNSSADTEDSEEGGGGSAAGTGADVPLPPVAKTYRGSAPAADGETRDPLEVCGGSHSHWSKRMPKGGP